MRIIAGFIMVGLFGLGLFIYQALLPETLGPRIVEVLESRLGPGHKVTIGATRLGFANSSGVVELDVDELSVVGADGREVAFAPEAAVTLDGGSLVGGEIAVSSLRLERPRLVLRLPDEAAAAAASEVPGMAAPNPAPAPDETPGPLLAPQSPAVDTRAPRLKAAETSLDSDRDLLRHLLLTLDKLTSAGGAAAALDEVRVSSASITLERGDGTAPEKLEDMSLRLQRNPATNGFSATIGSEDGLERWSATLTSTPPSADGRTFDLGIDRLKLSSLRRMALGGESPTDATVSGHLSLQVRADMSVSGGEARLDVLDFKTLVPDAVRPMMTGIEKIALRGRWDGAKRAFVLDPTTISDEAGTATLAGQASLPPEGSSEPVQITLQAGDVLIAGEKGSPPLRLDRIAFKGAYKPAEGVFDLQVGQIQGPTAKIAMSGVVTLGDNSPGIALGLAAAPTTVEVLKRLWPRFLLSNIREWLVNNVHAGTLSGFQLALDIKPGELAALKPYQNLSDGAVHVETSFTDGIVTPKDGLPTLAAMVGSMKVTGRTAFMNVESAQVDTPAGPMRASGTYLMPDTNPKYPVARVALRTDGPVAGIAQLFAEGKLGDNPLPPFISPQTIRGTVDARADADFTLGDIPELPAPVVSVEADLKDIALPDIIAGQSVDGGNFKLTHKGVVSTLKGEARVAGAPAKIDIVDEGPKGLREVNASATLDAAARGKLGFPADAGVKGPVDIKVRLPLTGGPVNAEVDFAAAAVDGLLPGFRKKAGAAGKLSVQIERNGNLTNLNELVLVSGPVLVKGDATLDSNYDLTSAKLSNYRLSATDDVRINVERSKAMLKLAINGSSFDLRPMMTDLFTGKAGEESSTDFDLDLSLGNGTGYNGEAVTGLKMSMLRRGGRLRELELKADRIGGGTLSVQPTREDGTFLVSGTDAGSFFRFLDIYGKAIGGRFTLRLTSAAAMSGLLEVDNFQVRGEKALASVAGRDITRTDQGTRRTSSDSRTTSGDPQTVQFTKLRMRFDRAGGRMTLRDVVLWGPQIGLSLEGALDFDSDRVSVVGTFVPAFALNNLFSKLPVIGFFLGGGAADGLVGVTFRVTGKLSAPTLTINPMSAVAPGFLRKLFEFRQQESGAGRAAAENTAPRGTAAPPTNSPAFPVPR